MDSSSLKFFFLHILSVNHNISSSAFFCYKQQKKKTDIKKHFKKKKKEKITFHSETDSQTDSRLFATCHEHKEIQLWRNKNVITAGLGEPQEILMYFRCSLSNVRMAGLICSEVYISEACPIGLKRNIWNISPTTNNVVSCGKAYKKMTLHTHSAQSFWMLPNSMRLNNLAPWFPQT